MRVLFERARSHLSLTPVSPANIWPHTTLVRNVDDFRDAFYLIIFIAQFAACFSDNRTHKSHFCANYVKVESHPEYCLICGFVFKPPLYRTYLRLYSLIRM